MHHDKMIGQRGIQENIFEETHRETQRKQLEANIQAMIRLDSCVHQLIRETKRKCNSNTGNRIKNKEN